MEISQNSNHAFRNPWVLGMLGFILVVVGINVFFITTAINTSPGLVDKNYYEKGRYFEQSIEQRREMVSRLGWDMRVQVPEEIIMNQRTTVYMNVVDRVGMPLEGASAQLHAYRPSDANADFTVEMTPYAPGIFSADVSFALRGIWDLKVLVSQGEDNIEERRRISVQTN